MEKKKILFIGLESNVIDELKNLFEKERYIPLFAVPSEAEDYICRKKPVLIAAADSSQDKNYKLFYSIKKIAAGKNIPLITVASNGKIKPFLTVYNEDISAIIKTPVMKQDFFRFLDRCVEESTLPEIDFGKGSEGVRKLHTGISDFTGSLVLNIIARNSIVQKLMRKYNDTSRLPVLGSDKSIDNRVVEEQLWEALEKKQFRLFYQPVISLATGKLSGFEALIRLDDPEKGIISPDKFISVAENSAIIFPLGLWIIEEACRQIKSWKEKFILDTPVRINVNLSARQFIHPDLTAHILEITDRYGIDHNDVGFELTESAFMEDMESANISLLELRSKKFPLYMDDFGTGYSSLSYLMHFPVDLIKIDQSFVKWMHIDEQSETLVKSLVSLAHNLGLKVVAEGVDDESHIDILKDCGCDYGQGFLFAKPLAADKAEEFVSGYFKTA